MTARPILLIGGPDSGKTNFVGCLWESLRAGKGRLIAPTAPERVKYVEDALEHVLQGRFAPRTEPGSEDAAEPFTVPVIDPSMPSEEPLQLVVPDVTGELWTKAVETCELASQWMTALKEASGILLFVRIGSDQNVAPLDWVTSARLLALQAQRSHAVAAPARDADDDPAVEIVEPEVLIPTQVYLCELLRFVEQAAKGSGKRKRVAVLVTAWDRLDRTRAKKGPNAYLEAEYPLFHGRLQSLTSLDVELFGVSAVGGDFVDQAFRKRYLDGDPKAVGYVVRHKGDAVLRSEDLTVPVAWILGAASSAT